MTQCRDCDADIIFAENENGKNLPFDERPSSLWSEWKGKYVIIKGKSRRAVDVDVRLKRELYTCHFDTCTERK